MAKSLIVDQVDAGSSPVARAISELDLYWLAGILEGEGSFMSGPPSSPNNTIISLHMTDEDVVARVAWMFGRTYLKVRRKQKSYHKDSFATRMSGSKARELMARLRPLMGKRRKSQIDRALESFDPGLSRRIFESRRLLPILDLEDVRNRHASGESYRKIGRLYGLNHETIRQRVIVGYQVHGASR